MSTCKNIEYTKNMNMIRNPLQFTDCIFVCAILSHMQDKDFEWAMKANPDKRIFLLGHETITGYNL